MRQRTARFAAFALREAAALLALLELAFGLGVPPPPAVGPLAFTAAATIRLTSASVIGRSCILLFVLHTSYKLCIYYIM